MTLRNHRDISVPDYTVTSLVDDRTIAGDESTAANIAAVLATLISDLQNLGILTGTEAA